jgi:hypothetical protein
LAFFFARKVDYMQTTVFEKTGKLYVPITPGRNRDQFDVFQLPKGGTPSVAGSAAFICRVQNDAALRENLEKAEKRTGKKIFALGFARQELLDAAVRSAMMRNEEKAQKIMEDRSKSENIKETENVQKAVHRCVNQ